MAWASHMHRKGRCFAVFPGPQSKAALSARTTIHRTALFCIHSDFESKHTHIQPSIYASAWIDEYTHIYINTLLICILILKSCYVSVKDSSYSMRAHSNLKTHTRHSCIVGRIPTDLHVQSKTHKFVVFGDLTKKQPRLMDQKYTAAASQQTH